jgi:hypothetical protein
MTVFPAVARQELDDERQDVVVYGLSFVVVCVWGEMVEELFEDVSTFLIRHSRDRSNVVQENYDYSPWDRS